MHRLRGGSPNSTAQPADESSPAPAAERTGVSSSASGLRSSEIFGRADLGKPEGRGSADFFRLIHEISGLNVVVDPNVKGSLTIVLDNVPWDQALDIALKNNDLDKQLDGNVLRIATKPRSGRKPRKIAIWPRLRRKRRMWSPPHAS